MEKYNKVRIRRVRTRRIGASKYRRIICNTETPIWNWDVYSKQRRADKKGNTLPILEDDIYDCHPRRNRIMNIITRNRKVPTKISQNHPLVNKGIGYWINEKTICTGYNIGNVYRPIFNHKRETMFLDVRKDIVLYAKILVSSSRDHLYKKELMKLHNRKIPEEIVEHIANYAWDIMLLLYP